MSYNNLTRTIIEGFLMFIGSKGIITRITAMIFLLGTVAMSYLGFNTSDMTPEQNKFLTTNADQVFKEIVEEIPLEIESISVVYFSGDPSYIVADTLRNRLSANTDKSLNVPSKTIKMKIREFFNMSLPTPDSPEDLKNWGIENGTDAVLSGNVVYDKKKDLKINWKVTQTESGDEICMGEYTPKKYEEKKNDAQIEDNTANKNKESTAPAHFIPGKGALWLLIILIFPILTIKYIEDVMKKESNSANLTALFVYTSIDMIACALLIPFHWNHTFSVAIFVILTVFCFFYNVFIFSLALKNVS